MRVSGVDGMIYPLITGSIDIPLSSERTGGRFILCPLINDGTIQPVDRFPFRVRFDEILHYLRSNFLQEITKISDYRKIPANSLFLLRDVPHPDSNYWSDYY